MSDTFKPINKEQLIEAIDSYIASQGPNDTYIDEINDWDITEIHDMDNLFKNKITSDDINDIIYINNWDVHNVRSMDNMFYNCTHFNSELGDWDVRNVESMNSMFKGCTNFNSDIHKWEIKYDADIEDMFVNCPIRNSYKPIQQQPVELEDQLKKPKRRKAQYDEKSYYGVYPSSDDEYEEDEAKEDEEDEEDDEDDEDNMAGNFASGGKQTKCKRRKGKQTKRKRRKGKQTKRKRRKGKQTKRRKYIK